MEKLQRENLADLNIYRVFCWNKIIDKQINVKIKKQINL